MSNINDKATVSLFVNGEQAEDAMDRLRKKAEDLDKQLQAAMAAGDKKTAKSLQRELDKVSKELNRTESAAKGTGVVLNNLCNTSIHGLRNALKYLQRELSMTKPDTEQWNDLAEKIELVKGRITELNEELDGGQSLWGSFKSWAEDTWPAIDLLSRGYDTAIDALRGYVDAYASMDQEMANVRKFTGMTAEQVADLNKEFKNMDTRTTREDLNKLAQEAGRLGKTTKEDVLGYVRAADQINVALDDLGDGATLTLSKLTGVFGVEDVYGTEKSLLKVGSVVNELSQNCRASAPYLTNFAERMGGVGAQAGMTIDQIMGLGAVLDSNALKVEASSTAISQVLVRMMQDPAKYAKVAGLEVDAFAKKLKIDANGALLEFLDTLNKAGGMDVLSPMFKDMGENGSRAIAALSTLAIHIDEVKNQQEAAAVAFREGTSIGTEFSVQNNTVAAALDKCKKRATELKVTLGEQLYPLMKHMLTTGSAVIKGLMIFIEFVKEHKTEIIAITASTTAYIAIMKIHSLWLDRLAVKTLLLDKLTVAYHVTTKALGGVFAVCRLGAVAFTNAITYLTNVFRVNYAMQQRWRASMEAMKFSSWVGLILAVASAIYMVTKRLGEATQKQKSFNDAEAEAASAVEVTASKIRQYQKILEDNTSTYMERYEAVKMLKEIMSEYNGYLDDEGRLIGHNADQIERYIASLKKKALAKALEGQMEQAYRTLIEKAQAFGHVLTDGDYDDFMKPFYSGDIDESLYLKHHGIPGTNFGSYKQDRTDRNGTRFGAVSLDFFGSNEVSEFNDALDTFLALSEAVGKNKINEITEKTKTRPTVVKALYDVNDMYKTEADEIKRQVEEKMKASDGSAEAVKAVQDFEDFLISRLNDKFEKEIKSLLEDDHDNDSPDPDVPQTDRFAEEKAWRDRQEAEARIAYARGEATFSKHTARMSTIAADYYERLLAREDVFGDERLKIEADYEESISKERSAFNKVSIAEEDRNYQDLLDRLRSNHQDRLNQEGITARERQREQEYYAEVLELAELQHLQNILDIYEEGSDEWLEAQRRFQEKEIAAQQRHLQNMERQQQMYADIKKKVFGMNQNEKDAEFARQFAALTDVYNRELAIVGDNEAEKLRIKEAYMAAELAMRKEYNQEGAEDSRSSYETSIGKSVEWLQGDGGKALTGAVSTLTSGMSAIFSGLSSMIQAELEIQTAKIETRYNREIELAQGNSYKVAKLEEQKEKQIAKAKNEANKKMFAMQVFQAVAQTAQNALSAYGSAAAIPIVGYIMAPIAAAMAVAAGAIQVAAIKKQQQASEAQGYSQGGFTKPGAVDEPAGIVHAGEWVASQKLLASPVARPMIEALDYAQRTNTIGSLKAEDVSRSIRANDSLARIAEDDGSAALMVAAVAQNAHVIGALVDRLNEPFVTVNTVTGDHGIKQAEDEYTRLINNVTPKSKRKNV